MAPQLLDATLAIVEGALAQLAATGTHLVPDLVLRSYLHDALENAKVVQFLIPTALRHRSFPNARACFEASQYALMLVSDPNYDLAGARAWLHAHRKDLRQSTDAEQAGLLADLPDHLPAKEFFANRLEEMVQTWNDFSSGKGDFLRQAGEALDRQSKGPDNWAGVNIAQVLEQRLDAIPNPKGIRFPPFKPSQILRSAYALLNRETHPHSSRLDPARIIGSAQGSVDFDFGPDDSAEQADLAETITASSLNLAMAAIALRLQMDRSA